MHVIEVLYQRYNSIENVKVFHETARHKISNKSIFIASVSIA